MGGAVDVVVEIFGGSPDSLAKYLIGDTRWPHVRRWDEAEVSRFLLSGAGGDG
jgi:hypothetical protein